MEAWGKNGAQYLSIGDLRSYGQVPAGFMSLKEGAEHYHYNPSYLSELVKKAKIPTINVLREVHFSVKDFERFLKIPDGYKILDEAAEDSIFKRDTIRKLLGRGKVQGIKKFNAWYVSMASLGQYEDVYKGKKESNKASTTSIDDVVNSIVDNL